MLTQFGVNSPTLGATKPGRKFTISSINSKLNSPVYNLSLNPYLVQLLPRNLLDMRTHITSNHHSDKRHTPIPMVVYKPVTIIVNSTRINLIEDYTSNIIPS